MCLPLFCSASQQWENTAVPDTIYPITDPTGTILTVLDEAQEEVGQIVYDGFGGVLTSTLAVDIFASQGVNSGQVGHCRRVNPSNLCW